MHNQPGLVKRPLTLDDLQSVGTVGTASVSADSRYLVYVTTRVSWEEDTYNEYISVIHLDTMIEVGNWEGSAPQWSPVANVIAYIANYLDETYISTYSLDTNRHNRLARVIESHYFMGHVADKNFAWSPDGSRIAYISASVPEGMPAEPAPVKVIERLLYKTKGGRGRPLVADNNLSHAWIVDVDSGITRLLTDGPYNEHSIAWSPDGSQIAFISNRSANPDDNQFYDLWSIAVDTGTITRYTKNIGTLYQPCWSPDGLRIAFLATLTAIGTNDSPAVDAQVYVTDSSRRMHCLTDSLDRRVEQFSWHQGGTAIYFIAGNHGTTAIYKVDTLTKEVRHVTGAENHILELTFLPGGNTICYVATDTTHLAEIFLLDERQNSSRQITNNNEALRQKCLLQPSESFWFKSFDNSDIQGFIIKPVNWIPDQKYPMVLVIHGGPHNMFGYEFEDRMQLLAANGYGVLFINPRGSSGYGQSFSNGCVLNWGGGDYQDLMAGVDAALEQYDWIDGERLGVTGQSYGGYMTNWIITQTNRFKAAVVDGGISNLVSFAGTSLYHSLIESEFNGSAYDHFPLLWQWSPLRNVKAVTTPTLIVHGEVDNEVPLSQAEEMFIALKKLGVETRFVQYLGEGHGWRPDLKPKNRQDLLKRTLEWFNTYLTR